MIRPLHAYHMHVGHGHVTSLWEHVAEEHFVALRAAQFDGEVQVGLVGDPDKRAAARKWLQKQWPAWELLAEADEGFEQVTLSALGELIRYEHPERPVLYCHTKGAFENWTGNHDWRRGLTAALVTNWHECASALEDNDLVGYHWATPEEFPALGGCMMTGNFWWATARYLKTLPPVQGGDPALGYNRYAAEAWIAPLTSKPNGVRQLGKGYPECYPACCNGRLHA